MDITPRKEYIHNNVQGEYNFRVSHVNGGW